MKSHIIFILVLILASLLVIYGVWLTGRPYAAPARVEAEGERW